MFMGIDFSLLAFLWKFLTVTICAVTVTYTVGFKFGGIKYLLFS